MLLQEVPDPTQFFVTRWSSDPWIQMAYSFVKTGGSGEAYDIIAEEIQGMVYFAGEVRPSPPWTPARADAGMRVPVPGLSGDRQSPDHGGPIQKRLYGKEQRGKGQDADHMQSLVK